MDGGWQKSGFFGQKFLEAVPMCENTFWRGARPKKGRKGHTCVGKVVRPRSDIYFSQKAILSEPKIVFFIPPPLTLGPDPLTKNAKKIVLQN